MAQACTQQVLLTPPRTPHPDQDHLVLRPSLSPRRVLAAAWRVSKAKDQVRTLQHIWRRASSPASSLQSRGPGRTSRQGKCERHTQPSSKRPCKVVVCTKTTFRLRWPRTNRNQETPESPLDSAEIQPVHPKGNQS